ncbi:winged helix-turn-helix domain-containing protein [Vibrio navarrensis]|nr:winged helix-turn-helix domain-containing protein [Vibrio navarrensis]
MQDFLTTAKEQQCHILISQLEYDPITRTLALDDEIIDLEPRTAELIELLLTHVGEPLSADTIIQTIWQSDFISRNVLTNRISTLRALLQKHLPAEDATKILVTYPHKGYFFSLGHVALKTPSPAPDAEPSSRVSPQQETKVSSGYPQIIRLLSLLCTVFALVACTLSYLYWHEKQTAIEKAREHQAIQLRELLLNRVDAIGPLASSHRKAIKALILEQQIEYPYTDIVNQDSPDYFVSPLEYGPYFPGAKNVRRSDYALNIRLKDTQDQQHLQAEARIQSSRSEKVVFKAIYLVDIEDLSGSLLALQQDIARFFNLPVPTGYDWALRNKGELEQLDKAMAEGEIKPTDEFTALYIARHFALVETDTDTRKRALEVLQTYFAQLPEELTVWLGILHFKVSSFDSAYDFLRTPVGSSRIDNAFIYLLLSDISHRQGKPEPFRLNYMLSIVALSRILSTEQLFERLAQPESSDTCYQPWQKLGNNLDDPSVIETWRPVVKAYCEKIGAELQKSLSITP